ncbi:Na+/H+ antiporter NhaA [Thiotrichales bacterium 19S9-12]|nr:Na+/H+ antiporter NhaA [Thiotrichales bacterium 19S9-11]MCF6811198.1 Na+/H+ antiporter NhaA [Thiotrichales bacterium 19S9-12]
MREYQFNQSAVSRLKKLLKVKDVFESFTQSQVAGAIILFVCAIIAMIWANTQYQLSYFGIQKIIFGLDLGSFSLKKTVDHWINEGLMAFFFLLVGLEVKREIVAGELKTFSKALLPIVAAVGGMIVPAIIYVWINSGQSTVTGWAIPITTDLAFVLGVMSLLGSRVPKSLFIFVSAAAVVDDILAVIIIAIFYTQTLAWGYLSLAFVMMGVLLVFNRMNVRLIWPYLLVGAILWYALLYAGIHATVAGVLIALAIPAKDMHNPEEVKKVLAHLTMKFDHLKEKTGEAFIESSHAVLKTLEKAVTYYETPLERLEHKLHVPVMYYIVPIFVLANAGVMLNGINFSEIFSSPVTLGIGLGLLIGKSLGIFLVVSLCVLFKIARLPDGMKLYYFLPASILSGIGFTMSIFVAELSFGFSDQLMIEAKVGILSASIICAVIGYFILWLSFPKKKH